MSILYDLFGNVLNLQWQQVVMWIIGGILIYLAIKKDMEPTLLLPMGFGTILVNIPLSGAICGSMTSTPGLAAAVDSAECDDPSAGYAACYPFALCSKVVLIIIMFVISGSPL